MTTNTNCKNWLATNAGISNCFVSSGINYKDPDNIPRTGGTGDVVNAFVVAHLIGKDTVIIIANTNYNQLKVINNNTDLSIDDVTWVYNNDGSYQGEPLYCYIAPSIGDVNFTSNPTGASIYIDNVLQTGIITPATITGLSPGSYTYKLTKTGFRDNTGNFNIISGTTTTVPIITLILNLSVSLTVNPNNINLGQSTTFTTTTSGGSANKAYTWFNVPVGTGCNNSNSQLICTPINPGTYSNIYVVVNDGVENISSNTVSLTVILLTLTTVTVSPTSTNVDVGAYRDFTATAYDQFGTVMSGITLYWSGVSPYASISPISGTTNASGQFTTRLTGMNFGTAILRVDSSPGATNGAATSNITVLQVLGSISPANPTINSGSSQQFIALDTSVSPNQIASGVIWSTTGGSISATGYYIAPIVTYSTQYTIFATYRSLTKNTTVTVNPVAPYGSISGNVKDSSNNNISGVNVSDGTRSSTTDSSGNYSIQDVQAGTYTVTASKSGYKYSSMTGVIVTSGNTTTDINFHISVISMNGACKNWLGNNAGLNRCYVPSGINYNDPDGISRTGSTGDVANAFLVAHWIGKDTVIIIANTNYNQLKTINGNIDIDLNDVSWVYSNDGSPVEEPQYCTITYGSISGNVKDSSNNNISGVNVSDGTRSSTTDSSGNYSIQDVPAGTYTVTAFKTRYISQNKSGIVVIAGYDTSNVNFSLDIVISILTTISIPITISIKIGESRQIIAVCFDQFDEIMQCPALTWTSSDPSKVVISATGVMTRIAKGDVTIAASTFSGTETIRSNNSVVITPIPEEPKSKTGLLIVSGVAIIGIFALMKRKKKYDKANRT